MDMCHQFLLAGLGKMPLYFPPRLRHNTPSTVGNSPKESVMGVTTLVQGNFYLSFICFHMTKWHKYWQGKKHLTSFIFTKCKVMTRWHKYRQGKKTPNIFYFYQGQGVNLLWPRLYLPQLLNQTNIKTRSAWK